MKFSNINIKSEVEIDTSSSINNVEIHENVKIAKNCSIFGSKNHLLVIHKNTYIGMNCFINGFSEKLIINNNVSIAQNVSMMTDSGPNASDLMQEIYPIITGPITIGEHSWICANVTIMPNVKLGKFCVVAANSLVTKSFDDYSLIAGSPAKLIKKLK